MDGQTWVQRATCNHEFHLLPTNMSPISCNILTTQVKNWSYEPAWQLRSTHSVSHPFSHEVSTSLFSNFWILARQRSKCPWSMSTCTWRTSKNTPPFPQAINPWKHVGLTVRPIAFCHVFHPTRSSNNSKSTLTVSHIFAGLTNQCKKDTFCLHYSPHVFKRCVHGFGQISEKKISTSSINQPAPKPPPSKKPGQKPLQL